MTQPIKKILRFYQYELKMYANCDDWPVEHIGNKILFILLYTWTH